MSVRSDRSNLRMPEECNNEGCCQVYNKKKGMLQKKQWTSFNYQTSFVRFNKRAGRNNEGGSDDLRLVRAATSVVSGNAGMEWVRDWSRERSRVGARCVVRTVSVSSSLQDEDVFSSWTAMDRGTTRLQDRQQERSRVCLHFTIAQGGMWRPSTAGRKAIVEIERNVRLIRVV